MTVAFNEIPYSWRLKGVYAEVKPRYDRKGLTDWPAKVIILGQLLAGGAGVALTSYPITRADQASGLFGAGSQVAQMVRALKKANTTTEVWAMGIADAGGGVATVSTLTLTGVPTASGTLAAYVQGVRIAVGVSVADTVSTIATALAAAINAETSIGVTASAAAGVVTVTAKHKGTLGNAIDLRIGYWVDDVMPAGVACVIAQSTAGATDPSIAAALAAITNDWYTDIVMPFTDSANMALLEADLARRYQAMGKLDAHAYTAISGTYASATTWSSTRNSPFVTTLPVKGAMSAPWEIAASLAGLAAFHLTNDPSRQLGSLVLPGILAPKSVDQYIDTEQNLMLGKGLSSWDAMSDGTVVLNRVVTNYTKTTLNVADDAWLDIMVPKTASRIRYDWNTYVSVLYPRHKLADDASPAVDNPDNSGVVVTPRTMEATWIGRWPRCGALPGVRRKPRRMHDDPAQGAEGDRSLHPGRGRAADPARHRPDRRLARRLDAGPPRYHRRRGRQDHAEVELRRVRRDLVRGWP